MGFRGELGGVSVGELGEMGELLLLSRRGMLKYFTDEENSPKTQHHII